MSEEEKEMFWVSIAIMALKRLLPILEKSAGLTPTPVDDRLIRVVKEILRLHEDGCFKRLLG